MSDKRMKPPHVLWPPCIKRVMWLEHTCNFFLITDNGSVVIHVEYDGTFSSSGGEVRDASLLKVLQECLLIRADEVEADAHGLRAAAKSFIADSVENVSCDDQSDALKTDKDTPEELRDWRMVAMLRIEAIGESPRVDLSPIAKIDLQASCINAGRLIGNIPHDEVLDNLPVPSVECNAEKTGLHIMWKRDQAEVLLTTSAPILAPDNLNTVNLVQELRDTFTPVVKE